MGVPGLWDVLNKTGRSRSLLHLAVTDGFEKNAKGLRGYRLGIDTSIWLHHASSTVQGENPELRGLFFRLVFLAKMPIIPLFIFDGRERPKVKRNSRLGKSGSHALARQFKKFIDAFGMEWREAPAEAEAELAHLNKERHIDAILTDDCDAFIFGAQMVIKNISKNLSGNRNNLATNSAGKTDEYHTMVYRAVDIENDPVVGMSRGGLILFALLSGGDYHKGVDKVGKKIAHAIARCGFGDQLLDAYQRLSTQEFRQFLGPWRIRVNHELRQNEMGFLPHRTSLLLPNDFPEIEILDRYARPNCSGLKHSGMSTSVGLRDRRDRDLGEIGRLCEEHFEWGYRTKIIERFRKFMWPCAVAHVLRRASLEADEKGRSSRPLSYPGSSALPPHTVIGTPNSLVKKYLGAAERTDSTADLFVNRDVRQRQDPLSQSQAEVHSLITSIVGTREHASTDALLEYRVEVSPVQLVLLTDAGIRGRRQSLPEKAAPKDPSHPNSSLRMWIPASIIHTVCPDLEEQYLAGQRNKGKGKRRARTPEATRSPTPPLFPSSPPTGRHQSSSQGRFRNQTPQSLSETVPSKKAPTLDPWFTSEIPRSVYQAKATSMDFLFTFQNPDDEKDEPSGSVGQARYDSYDGDDEDRDTLGILPARRGLDRLWGQILDAPVNPRRRFQKRASTPPFVDQPDARPKKRRKTMSDVLDLT